MSRSAADATSSRATALPHAYARVRPSPNTRRAITSPASPSGRSSASAASSSSSKNPSGTSSSASTYASEPSVPTEDASARAPRSSPIACAKIVFPAPVSPVTAFRPGAERQLRAADEDEVLDPEAAQHSCATVADLGPLYARGGVRPAVRDLAIVLGVSWIARALFVVAIGDAHSADVGHWEGALAAQDAGTNPYETGVLNWPPLCSTRRIAWCSSGCRCWRSISS